MNIIAKLKKTASDRTLLLDGAIGTLIQSMGLVENDFRGERFAGYDAALLGNYDILTLTKPELITSIHRSYLDAGADIIKTNTFSSSVLEQDHYKTSGNVYEINFTSAKIAKKEADKFTSLKPSKPRFVAGVIGPTRYTCSKNAADSFGFDFKSFAELKKSYTPQVAGLVEGGVDLLLLETIFHAENARAALSVLNEFDISSIPIWLSATVIPKFKNRDIDNLINEVINLSKDYNVFCIGLNCSTECENRNDIFKKIKDASSLLASIHPSAGLPDKNGRYSDSAEMFSNSIKKVLDNNLVDIVGGCCGTTPEYIKLLTEII